MNEVQEDLHLLRQFFQEFSEKDRYLREQSDNLDAGREKDGRCSETNAAIAHQICTDSNDMSAAKCSAAGGVSSSLPTASHCAAFTSTEVLEADDPSRRAVDLVKKVAELTAECARLQCELTDLDIQKRALAAGNSLLQEEVVVLRRRTDGVEEEKKAVMDALQKEQKKFSAHEVKWTVLARDFELLKKDYHTLCEHQWEGLTSASAELEKLCRKLSQENVQLKEKNRLTLQLEERLKEVEEENVRWKREATTQSAHREQWEQDWEEVQYVSHHLKELSDQLRSYWSSTQREGVVLRETLEAAHFLLEQWEDNATAMDSDNSVGIMALPPLPEVVTTSHSISLPVTSKTPIHFVPSHDSVTFTEQTAANARGKLQPVQKMEESRLCDGDADSFSTSLHEQNTFTTSISIEETDHLLRLLEAKTVDLTISLQAALTEAQLKNEQYEALASKCLLSPISNNSCVSKEEKLRTSTTLEEELGKDALLPLCNALRRKNMELEAKLRTTENAMNVLLDLYHNLLQEYTEESYHNFRLEGALAERVLDRRPSSNDTKSVTPNASLAVTPRITKAPKKKNRFTIDYRSLH